MHIQYSKIEMGGLHADKGRLPVIQEGERFFVAVGEFRFPIVPAVVNAAASPGGDVELFVTACDVERHNGIAYSLVQLERPSHNDGRILFLLDWSCPDGDWSKGMQVRNLELKFEEFEDGQFVDANDEQILLDLRAEQHVGFTRTWERRRSSFGSQQIWDKVSQRCVLVNDGQQVLLMMEGVRSNTPVQQQQDSTKKSTALVPVSNSSSNTGISKKEGVVNFDDVIGQEQAKKVLREIVGYLRGFRTLQEMRADMPRGVLLYGDGGNGKTLLAKALAGEADVPFITQDPALLISPYPGEGVKNVHKMFEEARKTALKEGVPVIIFMDEIDVIGQQRPKGAVSGAESNRIETLNALLQEMDGFQAHPFPVIVLGTTNRVDSLDEALLRDGRLDRKIGLSNPKQPEMLKLLQHYSRNFQLGDDVELGEVAKKCAGMPASTARRVCNEAALKLFTANQNGQSITSITQEMLMESAVEAIREHIGRSKGKRFVATEDAIKLTDVIGQDQAKEDVLDVISYLKNPERFKAAGAAMPRGVLFTGGPGLGKTRLARAIAGEAEVPFFSISGSDFVEKYVGVGAQRVRDLFAEARRNAPCIIFIDEIDAVGKRRSSDGDGGNSERDQTLNQILVEMDGFSEQDDPIVVLAATNLKDTLDPALVRPGRLDREAKFDVPTVDDRIALFHYYTRNKKVAKNVKLEFFARNTFGFSPAQIEMVCNEAVLLSLREEAAEITAKHLDTAIIRVTMGSATKLGNVTKEDLMNTAVHEGGHAVVGYIGGGTKIARITVTPYGQSLGHVSYMNDDRHEASRDYLFNRIAAALAGRVATELVLGEIDAGPSSDFQSARSIAYSMVTKYGMSDLGPIVAVEGVQRSERELQAIEDEVKKILDEAYAKARTIIEENRVNFDRLVKTVLKKETILGPEFERIMAGRRVRSAVKVKASI